MNKCQFCPEMSYAKRAKEYLMDEQKTKTFAEWLLNYVKTHPNSYMTIERGFYGEFMMRICEMTKGRPIVSKCSLPGIEYEQMKLTIDEIFIDAAENLEKEIENYGK